MATVAERQGPHGQDGLPWWVLAPRNCVRERA